MQRVTTVLKPIQNPYFCDIHVVHEPHLDWLSSFKGPSSNLRPKPRYISVVEQLSHNDSDIIFWLSAFLGI